VVPIVIALTFVMLASGCFRKPTPNAKFDYQIGGAYAPGAGVTIVARDRLDPPVAGLYNICYVNGFQAQTEAESWWLTNHPTLVLRNAQGVPVKDTQWNELILDIRTPAKRQELGQIVGGWMQGCHTSGFQGVDLDNLDTYSRSGGLITKDQAVAYARVLSDIGHAASLAVGQKNAADLVPRKGEMGLDFAIAEECNHYDECGSYTAGYGTSVLVIEYLRADFTKGCQDWPGLSIVLRDVDVKPAGSPGYVYDAC
jgi:hypothetical protein